LSDEQITVRFANANSEIRWGAFVKVRYSPDLMLLYQTPVSFNILSRDFFASEDEWQRAVALAKMHVGKTKVQK
jgi:hypothetical protein